MPTGPESGNLNSKGTPVADYPTRTVYDSQDRSLSR